MRAIDPWFGLSSTLEAAKTVVIVGCPFESGDAFRPGADKGPAAIREWACTAEAINEVELSNAAYISGFKNKAVDLPVDAAEHAWPDRHRARQRDPVFPAGQPARLR